MALPAIGEIREGSEVGFSRSRRKKYIWSACEQCGKERWVHWEKAKGKARNALCLNCACRRSNRKGKVNPQWKGGRHQKTNGYIMVKLYPDDFFFPMAGKEGYVLEHRLVMAKHLGRCLHRWEVVHHKHTRYPAGSIEDKQDNRIENLQLVTDDRHTQITILENKIARLEKRVFNLEVENTLSRKELSRLKNLLPVIQQLELDSRALIYATASTRAEPQSHDPIFKV